MDRPRSAKIARSLYALCDFARSRLLNKAGTPAKVANLRLSHSLGTFVASRARRANTMKPITDARPFAESTDANLARNVLLFPSANRRSFRQISVSAENGTIRLFGLVHSFSLRQVAIAMAKRVADVRHVVDDLEVDQRRLVVKTAGAADQPSTHSQNLCGKSRILCSKRRVSKCWKIGLRLRPIQ